MFGIELDFVKKLEVGFCGIVLATALFFTFKASRPVPDPNITVYADGTHLVGMDSRLPISPSNPLDVKRSYTGLVFADHDGKLRICEYGEAADIHAIITYEPDTRRDSYQFRDSEWKDVESISDPVRRAMTLAAYMAIDNRTVGLLRHADLNASQLTEEKKARDTMMSQVLLADENAQAGVVATDLYTKTMAALAAYRAITGDVIKEPRKAAAARKVLDAGVEYAAKVRAIKTAAARRYVDEVLAMLDPDQKKKISDAYPQVLARANNMRRMTRKTG